MATLALLGILTATLLISIVVRWRAIKSAARYVHAKPYSRGTMAAAVFVPPLIGIFATLLLQLISSNDQASMPFALEVVLLVSFGIAFPWWYFSHCFDLSRAKAGCIWLIATVAEVGLVLIAAFLLRPYVLEAYEIPTNSMAPTILGEHSIGTCPECGRRLYGAAPFDDGSSDNDALRVIPGLSEEPSICDQFHIVESGDHLNSERIHGDRILALKFLTPRRWDIVVFQYPLSPEHNYVKRLIGLPGETVVIADGYVWIDGQKLDPPPEIAGLRYRSVDDDGHPLFGHPEKPAVLGEGEYFVLGDFSPRSDDSRFWGRYPIAGEVQILQGRHLIGVVTHRHWPISRWAALK